MATHKAERRFNKDDKVIMRQSATEPWEFDMVVVDWEYDEVRNGWDYWLREDTEASKAPYRKAVMERNLKRR